MKFAHLFIRASRSKKISSSPDQDEKSSIDFRDILYSEIASMPEDMVITI